MFIFIAIIVAFFLATINFIVVRNMKMGEYIVIFYLFSISLILVKICSHYNILL